MKNKDNTLIYDDECPLCLWYTGAFVKTGLLEKEGRQAFSTISPELLQAINPQRSRNEIPLLNNETKQVVYGIDALLEIIGQRCPVVRTTGHLPPVHWLLKKLYNFISFNRKVIVARKNQPGKTDCSPAFSARYRILFMAFFLLFNTAMLIPVHHYLLKNISFYTCSLAGLQLAHGVLVSINILLACTLNRKKAIEYLGQVNMLALITILLLTPLLAINILFPPAGWLILSYLVLLTLFVLKEYSRRMHYAGITEGHTNIMLINLLSLLAFMTCLFIL